MDGGTESRGMRIAGDTSDRDLEERDVTQRERETDRHAVREGNRVETQ